MPITPEQFQEMDRRNEANKMRPKHTDGTYTHISLSPVGDAVERERDLHSDVFNECKLRGWIIFRGSMAHKALRTLGEPDATILADRGRVFFIEMKTKTGKLSSEQLGLKMVAEKLGHPIHTIRSMSEFHKIVSEIDL